MGEGLAGDGGLTEYECSCLGRVEAGRREERLGCNPGDVCVKLRGNEGVMTEGKNQGETARGVGGKLRFWQPRQQNFKESQSTERTSVESDPLELVTKN